MEQVIVYTERQPHIAIQTKTARTGNPGGGGSIGQSPTEGGLLMGDNHVLSPILSTHLDSDKQDPQPDFPPRIVQRVDALCYSLPMLAPDGSRCHVVLVGSFAAWGALMTALVREGFAHAEPGRKFEPGERKGGAK